MGAYRRALNTALTFIFAVCSGLAIAGSLGATLGPAGWRTPSLAAVAIGAAGAVASLSAGLAALLVLIALGGSALLIAGLPGPAQTGAPRSGGASPQRGWRAGRWRWGQAVGAAAAVLLLAVLLYAALRGSFAGGHYPGGWFGLAGLGRAFLGRDALAFDAVAAMLLVGLAGAATARARR
jgi:hypothetical protein